MGDVHTRVYRHGAVTDEGFPLEEVSQHLAHAGSTVWIDLCVPSTEQLQVVAAELGLHELAVEDVLGPQRPKLDRYATHLFLSCHAVGLDLERGSLVETEVDAFIGQGWLVTIRENSLFDVDRVLERWDRSPDLAEHGVDFLLYGLLDVVVDGYFEVIQALDDYHELMSERIFAEQSLDPLRQRYWFTMRRAMFRFHRLVVPMREVCGSLVRREHSQVAEEIYPYFLDVHDHVLGVIEDLDSLRQVSATIIDTDLGLRGHRQNLIVKKVSGWAAIIAVPTLVTGYYGMNVPYPGSGEDVGVLTSTGLMIVACIVVYHLFRRRQWL
ncbi:magnesium transporter [Nocardioides guangzhouensis]|uniref:Magnesium transporter n=1 Tax=Nocardioides guangzhouensis TaxID=2497878 RepID=A0A4Q4ZAZ9_9ACTN|nr:magnesium transporter CorA family protein [Nocardioides guangzhouensis]RYP85072.1 magnesium transporter [Nocardioides guangzhouensis]